MIHKTAEVSPKTKIGEGTNIWQYSQVMEGAVVGSNCVIGHNCVIAGGAVIGDGVKIEANTDIWSGVTLGDYVFVGPGAVFTNDPNPRAKYPKKEYPEYGRWLPTNVEYGATIGANATIVCGSEIGKWAMIGAGAVVKGKIPGHAVFVGVPAKQIGWICECGNNIRFSSNKAVCKICGRKFSKKGQEVVLLNK